jgi:hypothetical protein
MRSLPTIAFLCATCCLGHAYAQTPQQTAPTLHVILAANTNDANLKNAIRENLRLMNELVKEIGDAQLLKISKTEVTGPNFNCKSIREALEGTAVEAGKDAILFHYSGHGFRDPNELLPEFACGQRGGNERLTAHRAKAILDGKNPRLMLMLSDACNKVVGGPAAYAYRQEIKRDPAIWKSAIKRLFVEYKGTLAMAGAKPGGDAYYRSTGGTFGLGGYFTRSFLDAFYTFSDRGAAARWENIADLAELPIETADGKTQYPLKINELQGP